MDWQGNPYWSLAACSWKWKLPILPGESADFWDISIIHLSVNSDNSRFCLTWVLTSILTWVQTLLEKVKTHMNHRVLTKLIHLIKNYKQLILKMAGDCENFGIIYILGRNSGQCPEFVATRGYKSTVMRLWAFYSEKIQNIVMLCNLEQFPVLQQRYHKLLWLNMSFK